jgi:hypothetical protein
MQADLSDKVIFINIILVWGLIQKIRISCNILYNLKMIALFKYESLLSNEYLVRKFEQDPYNP